MKTKQKTCKKINKGKVKKSKKGFPQNLIKKIGFGS